MSQIQSTYILKNSLMREENCTSCKDIVVVNDPSTQEIYALIRRKIQGHLITQIKKFIKNGFYVLFLDVRLLLKEHI